jgi:hypothetical protein
MPSKALSQFLAKEWKPSNMFRTVVAAISELLTPKASLVDTNKPHSLVNAKQLF